MNIELYASHQGVDLYKEYSAKEAAEKIGIGINAINKAANDNELPCIKHGVRNRVYLGLDLIQWKLSKRTGLGNTISQRIDKVSGAAHGTTNAVSKESSQVYALNRLKTLKSC